MQELCAEGHMQRAVISSVESHMQELCAESHMQRAVIA
jgi:hypothetical protein